jgi:acetyl esterase/lipase
MMASFTRTSLLLATVCLVAPLYLPAQKKRIPTQSDLVYGTADAHQLTMDYCAPKGRGKHPIVIIIHGGGYIGGESHNGSEAYCADFLAPAVTRSLLSTTGWL